MTGRTIYPRAITRRYRLRVRLAYWSTRLATWIVEHEPGGRR